MTIIVLFSEKKSKLREFGFLLFFKKQENNFHLFRKKIIDLSSAPDFKILSKPYINGNIIYKIYKNCTHVKLPL